MINLTSNIIAIEVPEEGEIIRHPRLWRQDTSYGYNTFSAIWLKNAGKVKRIGLGPFSTRHEILCILSPGEEIPERKIRKIVDCSKEYGKVWIYKDYSNGNACFDGMYSLKTLLTSKGIDLTKNKVVIIKTHN